MRCNESITVLMEASVEKKKSSLFWDITQRRVVILHRRLGTTYRSHFHGSRSLRRKLLELLDPLRQSMIKISIPQRSYTLILASSRYRKRLQITNIRRVGGANPRHPSIRDIPPLTARRFCCC